MSSIVPPQRISSARVSPRLSSLASAMPFTSRSQSLVRPFGAVHPIIAPPREAVNPSFPHFSGFPTRPPKRNFRFHEKAPASRK